MKKIIKIYLYLLALLFTSCYSKEEKLRIQKETWNRRIKEVEEKDGLQRLKIITR
ncbi:hypothetical protein ACE38W_03820 [Chitinophaga sp. Hz27]|uniref:hypothetical protein n=1 Tax=Chitinophaga sp. Hz27 TaxID=3347169 RepID=UPI0035D65554